MSDKKYKHKYYAVTDSLFEVFNDYPFIESLICESVKPNQRYLNVNEYLGYTRVKYNDPITTDLIHEILDKMENEGKL